MATLEAAQLGGRISGALTPDHQANTYTTDWLANDWLANGLDH